MKNKTMIHVIDQEICIKDGTSLGISSTDKEVVKSLLCNIARQQVKSAFYINHHQMLYHNMNVLEYLMFTSRHVKKADILAQQQELFELLISVGLDYICLTPIRLLTPEEKMVILLCNALCSNNSFLVFDSTAYEFNMDLIHCIKALITRRKKPDTTLIIGTMQPKLIGICLKETLFIHEEQIRYYGSVEELYHSMDRVLYVINHRDAANLSSQLELAFPMYEIQTGNHLIFVMRKASSSRDDANFFQTLAREGIIPDFVKINHGRVENSFQELIEFNAIF